MPFLHPLLFWLGLGGISIPILIHILNRRRFRIVDWAAMRFLLDALRKNRRRLRIEELILLALRCLIVLLAGAALARFIGCSPMQSLGLGQTGRTVVFVLDDSYSMGQTLGARQTFEAARDDLVNQIERLQLTPSDQVAILLTSQAEAYAQAKPGPDGQPADRGQFLLLPMGQLEDPEKLLGSLKALQPSDRRTHLTPAMSLAADLVANAEGKKMVFLFSDLRRGDLADEAETEGLRQAYRRIADAQGRITAFDYGRASTTNLTVEPIELVGRFAMVHSPSTRLRLRVRNNGTQTVRDVPVNVSVTLHRDDELATANLPIQRIESLAPGQVWVQEIPFVPQTAGHTVITAEVNEDDLPHDNRAQMVLVVRPATRVLVIDGHPATDEVAESDAESYFLVRALDPNRNGDHGYAVDVVARDDVLAGEIANYDVVYLVDVESFAGEPVKDPDTNEVHDAFPVLNALQDYVAAGGGLGIFAGPHLSEDFYNGPFYARGEGLSPLPITAPIGQVEDKGVYFQIAPQSISPTGLMGFYGGEAAMATQLIRFFAITPAVADVLPAPGERAGTPVIEARFNDSKASPAVVSRTYGKGQTVMFYSTASLQWNDWAMDAVDELQGLYVLYLADLTDKLSRPQEDHFTRMVGRDIVAEVTPDLRDATVTILPPGTGADVIPLAIENGDAQPHVDYSDPGKAGMYALTFTRPDRSETHQLFVRNPDPAEGDLAPADRKDLNAAFGSAEYTYLDRAASIGEAVDQAGPDKEYWVWMVAALLGLLALETYLAQRFGHWT